MKITKGYLKQLIKEELSHMEEAEKAEGGNKVFKVVGSDGDTIAHVGSAQAAEKLASGDPTMMRVLGLTDGRGSPWAWVRKAMPFSVEELSGEDADSFMSPESSEDSKYYGTHGSKPKQDYYGIYKRDKGSLGS